MKTFFHIFLLTCGVFGADEDEVKSLSVMEGDSVTLNPDPAQTQGFIQIQWRFGVPLIAQIDGKDISYPSLTEIFRDRLQLDQTGSLTIKNTRTKHSGLYELQIDYSNTAPSHQKFRVTVNKSPSIIDAGEAELKVMSVTEGDPVTLHVPQVHGDELIVWRFGDEGKLIAKYDIEAKSSPLDDDTDERFRDRLKLDQTGSLTITNTRTTDSGLYKVKISSNKQTLYKKFAVTVSEPGLSPGAIAGIVIGALLGYAAATAAAGVMYYCLCLRTTNLPSKMWSVPPGDDVTLNPETDILRGDEIQYLYGNEDTLIAEIKTKMDGGMTIHDGPDQIFTDRLELKKTTGSLTIKSINTEHTGLYTLKITRGRKTLYKKFIVSVKERLIKVMEGDNLTLRPATEIDRDDYIMWWFIHENQPVCIAEITRKPRDIVTNDDAADKRFRGRLELETTGSLTITDTRTAHSGRYKLLIRNRNLEVSEQTFLVTVRVREESSKKENNVSVEMPLLNGDDLDVVHEEEGTSSL